MGVLNEKRCKMGVLNEKRCKKMVTNTTFCVCVKGLTLSCSETSYHPILVDNERVIFHERRRRIKKRVVMALIIGLHKQTNMK